MRSVARFIWRTIEWLVILTASAAILVAVLIPRIFGATPYTIISGSMSPAIEPGALVVVKPVETSSLSVGDVVTVQLESGKDTVVTHRIAEIQYRADGQTQFITKGDANDVADTDPRLPIQIRGEVWYQVPYLGYVSNALTGAQRGWLVGVVILGLAGYAAWMYVSAARDRRRKAAQPTIDESSQAVPAAGESAPLEGPRRVDVSDPEDAGPPAPPRRGVPPKSEVEVASLAEGP